MKELKSTNELPFWQLFLSHLPSSHACQNPMLYRGICSILSRPKKETFQTLTTAEEIYSSMSLMWFFSPMSAAPQVPSESKVLFSHLPSSSPILPSQASSKSCPSSSHSPSNCFLPWLRNWEQFTYSLMSHKWNSSSTAELTYSYEYLHCSKFLTLLWTWYTLQNKKYVKNSCFPHASTTPGVASQHRQSQWIWLKAGSHCSVQTANHPETTVPAQDLKSHGGLQRKVWWLPLSPEKQSSTLIILPMPASL